MTRNAIPEPACETDIVIIGGGIAGLWLQNHLTGAGYSVLLLESRALGCGQSIASQGIIHGGLKYALGGSLSGAASAIAAMPARWRRCLAGDDPVDLSGCRLLSNSYYMWSGGSFRSRLKSFLGSKTLRGRIEQVAGNDYPEWLSPARGQGALYRLEDFVIDTSSLLETLAARCKARVFSIEGNSLSIIKQGQTSELSVESSSGRFGIRAQRIILAAGAGNGSLMQLAGLSRPQMQLRPLNMVVAKGRSLPEAFVHCIGDDFSLTPVMTLTSHPCVDGRIAWYMGGELAETGVGLTEPRQTERAASRLTELFPWIDQHDVEWKCVPIDRAEGREAGRHRPDNAFLAVSGNLMIAWPTKFTLSPALADEVMDTLSRQGIRPTHTLDTDVPARFLGRPTIASPPWENHHGAT